MKRYLGSRAGAFLTTIFLSLMSGAATTASAQDAPTPATMVATQQAAIAKLGGFNGLWRGTGWTDTDGKRTTATVTERVGPFLDGATQVIEGRSFAPDGKQLFHAFNNVMFDVRKGEYVMQARAGGLFGNFPLRVTPDGYVWELIFGGSGLRYTGTVKDGVWTEVSEHISPDKPPEKFSEFRLQRIGDSDWPESGALRAR